MNLTVQDLDEIRNIVRTEVSHLDVKFDALTGTIDAIENDVKEIYQMISELQNDQQSTNKFLKLSLEEKILKAYTDIVATAKQAGITLPRS